LVGFPAGAAAVATVEFQFGPGDLIEASVVSLSPGETNNWRVLINGYAGPWFLFTVPNTASPELDVSSGFVEVKIITPSAEAYIQIKKVDGLLATGDTVTLPAGRNNVEYRAVVGTLKGPWKSHDVPRNEPTLDFDASDEFILMVVDIPDDAAEVDGFVEFHRIFESDGSRTSYFDDGSVYLPDGIPSFQFRVGVNRHVGAWEEVNVVDENHIGENPIILDTTPNFVVVVVDIPDDATAAGATIEMKNVVDMNGNLVEFGDGDSVILPARDSAYWRVFVNGLRGDWMHMRTRIKAVRTLEANFAFQSVQFNGINDGTDTDTVAPSVQIRGTSTSVMEDEPFVVPINSVLSWRPRVNGYKGAYTDLAVGAFDSTMPQVNVQDKFCLVTATNYDGHILNFVGGLAPKSVTDEASLLHFLAGQDVEYRIQGVEGEFVFSVPDAENCPATFTVGSDTRKLLRRG
jgi:hypothetical protein